MYLYFDYAHKASWHSVDQSPNLEHELNVHQVLKDWDEYSVTSTNTGITGSSWYDDYLDISGLDIDAYSTQAGYTSTEYLPSFNHRWVEFDVTNAVKNWLQGEENYGLLIKVNDETIDTRDLRFFSRENTQDNECEGANYAPKLYLFCQN